MVEYLIRDKKAYAYNETQIDLTEEIRFIDDRLTQLEQEKTGLLAEKSSLTTAKTSLTDAISK